jgi:hypothetical protein
MNVMRTNECDEDKCCMELQTEENVFFKLNYQICLFRKQLLAVYNYVSFICIGPYMGHYQGVSNTGS